MHTEQSDGSHERFPGEKNKGLIFLCVKTEDFPYAEQVYQFLLEHGFQVFFLHHALQKLDESDSEKEIHKALDNTKHMIVVTSKKEFVETPWIKAQWDFFVNEKRAGREPAGKLFTLIAGSMRIEDLPQCLRDYETIPFDPNTFDKILTYLN